MAIGIVATLKVQPGKGGEFEKIFADLADQVRANEPGNSLYQVFKSRKDADTYVVMEIYSDQAALDAHGKSDYFKAAGPKLGPTLAGRPDILYLDSF
ncbi:MAG: antibiotic biosynthesis monooxygenase [Alphaproteobacteria bacterium]|nr:antibiotic biosynthesis monooxygenase [Alphaproteobacteria bacterium]